MAYQKRHGLSAYSPPGNSTVQQALASASAAYNVPLSLLQALAFAESSYNPAAVSSKGAQGLMQLMPATAASLGVTDPFDPQQSANGSAKYLSQLNAQYGGDWYKTLVAYNEGPGNLQNKGVFSSSDSYANGILSNAGMLGSGSSTDLAPDSTAAPTSTDFSSLFTNAGADLTAAADSMQANMGASDSVYVLAAAGLVGLLLWLALRG